MKRSLAALLAVLALASCRDYDLESHLTDQDGLIPADRFARYGREQAQEMAIAREYGRQLGSGKEQQAEAAMSYARSLPDVIDIQAHPLGYRLTVRLRSGWLTMVNPVDDGRPGRDTPGVPAGTGQTR